MPDLYLPMSDAYTPRRTVEEIVALYKHRVDAMGPVHAQMRRIREAVNGDIVVPLNELDRNAKVDAANLMLQGLDQMGMRVSSVMPGVWFPPMSESERHKKVARDKKNAILSMWDEARMPMKVRRRARHMLGYSSTPVMVCPDFKKMTVKWRVINPIDLFPAERDDVDDPVPDDTIRVFSMPYATALRRYPQMVGLRLDRRKVADPACRVNVLEYQDGYEVTQIAMGDRENPMVAQVGSAEGVRLAWAPNRAGRPLVVCPERIVMDRARGAYDDMLGMFYSRARLQALNLIAVEKGIFPNEWLVARPGEDPQIIQEADGRLGQVGIVSGGDIRTENLNPGYKTDTAIDRIERQERNSGGIPAEFGGESTSNIRTGRRGDSVLSATVDFRVQEAQALLADSLKAENEIAIAVELGYWGDAPRSFHIPGKAKDGDYTPSKLWEVTKHFVTYSMPGADVNNLVVGLGQRVGTGLMSKETARESDPLIADPDLEHDRITREGLEAALFASIQAQANDPAGPYQPADLAYLTKLVMEEGKTLYQAIEDTQRRAQERQAAAVPEGAPEAMPGMSPPGMGMEQPTIGPPDESVSNLAQMMGQLRRPAAVAEAMA